MMIGTIWPSTSLILFTTPPMLPRTMSATESRIGVDELGDPAGVVDEEHHHVVDQLAGLDECGGRVEQPDQPGDAGGDDPVLDEVLDLVEDHLLDVAELFQQHLPQSADALGAGDDLEDLHALLDRTHRLLADLTCTIRFRMLAQVSPKIDARNPMMPLMSKDFGSSIPPSASAPNSQLIRPRRRWPRKSSLNLRMPPFTPSIRLPGSGPGA